MSAVTAVPIRPLSKGSVLRLWLGLLLVILAAGALAWWGTNAMQVVTTASGLRYQVVDEGQGDPITAADLVALRYRLRVGGPDGEVIQDSQQTGQPFVTSTQGAIRGFSEGLLLMREGGSYRLWIPPRLGYGNNVPPGAPFGPNDTLYFEIEVQQIARGMAALQQMMGGPGGPGGAGPGGAGPGGNGAGAPPEGGGQPSGAGPGGADRESPGAAESAPPSPTGNIQ